MSRYIAQVMTVATVCMALGGSAAGQTDSAWIDFKGHPGKVSSLSFSPDGRQLASVGEGARGAEVRIWEVATGTSRVLIADSVSSGVIFLADGKSVIAGRNVRNANGNLENRVTVWNVAAGAMGEEIDGTLLLASPAGTAVIEKSGMYSIWRLSADGNDRSIEFKRPEGGPQLLISPDGKTVALYTEKAIRLFDVAGHAERAGIEGLRGSIRHDGLAFLPDGKQLCCTTDQSSVSLWDIGDPSRRPRLLAEQQLNLYGGFAISPDGAVIAGTAGDLRKIILVEARTLTPRGELTGSTPVQFSTSGTLVARALGDGGVVVANADGNTRAVVALGDKADSYASSELSRDGTLLAFAHSDGSTIRLLKLPAASSTGVVIEKLADLSHPQLSLDRTLFDVPFGTAALSFSIDGKYAIGCGDRYAPHYAVWETATGRLLASGWSAGWTLLPDGKTLYTQEFDGRQFFEQQTDLTTGKKQVTQLPRNVNRNIGDLPYGQLALTPDQKSIAGAFHPKPNEEVIVLMPGGNRREAITLGTRREGDSGTARRLSYSPDGKLFAVCYGNKVRVFDLVEKRERPTTAQDGELFMSFIDAGAAIGTAGQDGGECDFVRVYDLESGQKIHEIKAQQGHSADVKAAAFSPVGRLYVTCDADGTVLVKNWETGAEVARFKAHDGEIIAAAFSADGKILATGVESKEPGFVRMWSLGDLK